jgi:hypothetical protein
MKRSILIGAVLAVAAAGLAGQQPQPPTQPLASAHSLSATVKKPTAEKKVEVFTTLTKKVPPSNQTEKVERVDGMSSQPWSKMVGPRPGWSAFTDPERRDVAFDVFWMGAPPTH